MSSTTIAQSTLRELLAENAKLRQALEASRMAHLVNDYDCWYSCPLSGECCDDAAVAKGVCTCGADEHNKRIDEALA